ncbi:hypothetical protein JCM39194_08320 [Desulfotomaculum varum]
MKDYAAREAVQENERVKEFVYHLANIIEYSNQPFAAGCVDGTIVACNQAFCDLLGYTKEEILKLSWVDLTPDDWFQNNIEKLAELTAEGFPLCYEKEYRHKNGARVPVEIFVQRAREQEDCQFFYAFIKDISQHKQYQRALQGERRRIFSFFDSLPFIVHLMDKNYSIVYANDYVKRYFDDAEGPKCYQVFENRTEPCEFCVTYSVFTTRQPYRWEWHCQKNGRIYDLYAYPFTDYDGTPLVLELGFDITEKKQLEQEMARLDRLNLIGEMAASLGHEVRNPLTTVRGLLQLLQGKPETGPFKDYFDLMIEELDRANSIITEFLSLARNKVCRQSEKNLNEIILALLPLLQAEAVKDNKDIRLQLSELPNLLVDEKEIRQLILNLVKNGLEAMPPNSILTISTFIKDAQVVMAVQDQGKGIASGILEKLGTPFFTTKDHGTGLGLAICYSIAERHQAKITVETSDAGTTFFVAFKKSCQGYTTSKTLE